MCCTGWAESISARRTAEKTVRRTNDSTRIWEEATPGMAAAIMSRPTGKSARTISETSASEPTDSEKAFHLASSSSTWRRASSSTYSVMLLPVVSVIMKPCTNSRSLRLGWSPRVASTMATGEPGLKVTSRSTIASSFRSSGKTPSPRAATLLSPSSMVGIDVREKIESTIRKNGSSASTALRLA